MKMQPCLLHVKRIASILSFFRRKNRLSFTGEVVATDALMNVPDTFFSMENAIFYIKDKKILRSIILSPTPYTSGKKLE